MKSCSHFYRVRVVNVEVPETFQRHTRLPGDPQGNSKTGYALRRRELLSLVMKDRLQGGNPQIDRVMVEKEDLRKAS
jgi:hypothetical protein